MSTRPRVHLMGLPWAPVYEPSLGLAILKSALEGAGIETRVRHCSLFLLEYLKFESYEALGSRYGLNDFLFTYPFERSVRNTYRVITLRSRQSLDPAPFIEYVQKVRNEAIPKFLEDCLRVVEETEPTMVGFTCMFDQTVASLALAQLIKARYPEVFVAFGGYALEDPVGRQIIQSFPFVDVVVSGEGEDRIVALAEASLHRDRLPELHGIHFRDTSGLVRSNRRNPNPVSLDDSPIPDYDDFYADVEELASQHSVHVDITTLPVESSRGCWWGQVRHCVFCGIDDDTMKYRSKRPETVQRMLEQMYAKYGDKLFRFSDYILPRSYYKTLLPNLAAAGGQYKLHWEMKANVRADEVRLMKSAGIVAVQPGIESFSTPVLKRMEKGVTGIQNVLTIKLLTEHELVVNYNILFGFPNDEAADYRELVRNVPLLYHLPPPFSYVPVQMTRYAPLQANPARFGIATPIVADDAYQMVFSRAFREVTGFHLDDYAYVFETPYEFKPDCAPLYDFLVYQIASWIETQAKREVRLSYEYTEAGVLYRDSRFDSEERRMEFGPVHARLQELLADRIWTPEQLSREYRETPAEAVHAALDDLEKARLLFREGASVVGLALPSACYERWKQREAVIASMQAAGGVATGLPAALS